MYCTLYTHTPVYLLSNPVFFMRSVIAVVQVLNLHRQYCTSFVWPDSTVTAKTGVTVLTPYQPIAYEMVFVKHYNQVRVWPRTEDGTIISERWWGGDWRMRGRAKRSIWGMEGFLQSSWCLYLLMRALLSVCSWCYSVIVIYIWLIRKYNKKISSLLLVLVFILAIYTNHLLLNDSVLFQHLNCQNGQESLYWVCMCEHLAVTWQRQR